MKLRLIIALLLCISFADLIAQPNKGWEGEWKARKNYTFKITNVTDKTFDYSFNCFNGTNIGEAEGKANINGNLAISIPPEENTCKIKFILNGDNIEVIDIMENDCYVDAGNGVRYNGKYKKTSNDKKAKKK